MGNLLSVWSTVGSVALAILILLVMITIHEFGHYIAGKSLKFKIDEFSVGFGPALFKIKRKKSGELFAVRLIPLGGYCAFHGEDGLEEEQAPTPEEELPDLPTHSEHSEGSHKPTEPDPAEEKIHVELTDSVQGDPSVAALSQDERVAADSVQGDPSVAALSQDERVAKRLHYTDDGGFTHMKPWKRIIVLIAGAAMNYLLALLLILIEFSAYGQSVVMVRGVEPSEEWGTELSFREGDILLGAEGRAFYLTTDIAAAINHRQAGDRVKFRVSRVQEDGSRQEETVDIVLRSAVEVENSADFRGVWGALGVGVETREDGNRYYMLETASYRFGFFGTIGRSFVYSFRLAGSIFKVIGELLTGRLGLSALGGPVTTITMTSQIASQGFRDFLEISALIGVNLAVFNLLPIPALDGSKVVFTVIEWVRGKPISRKIEAIIHAAGFVILIGFAILVDVLQFV